MTSTTTTFSTGSGQGFKSTWAISANKKRTVSGSFHENRYGPLAQSPTSSGYSEPTQSPLKKINAKKDQAAEKMTIIEMEPPKFRDMAIEEEKQEFTAKQLQCSKLMGICQMESVQTDPLSRYKLSPRPIFAPQRFAALPPKLPQVFGTEFKLTSPTLLDASLCQLSETNSQVKFSNAIRSTAFLNDRKRNQLILRRKVKRSFMGSVQYEKEPAPPINETQHEVIFDSKRKTDMLNDSFYNRSASVYPKPPNTPSHITRSTDLNSGESLSSEQLSLTEYPEGSNNCSLSPGIACDVNNMAIQFSQPNSITRKSTNFITDLVLLSRDTRPKLPALSPIPRAIARPQERIFVNEQAYWMSPTHEQLRKMSLNDLKQVPNFIVGRKGFGKIEFMEPVDLSGAEMNKNWTSAIMGRIVVLKKRACALYPKAQFDGEQQKRPVPGQELNVHCMVYLEEVWCLTRDKKETIKDPQHPMYQRHLERLRKVPNVEFEAFDALTGTWIFNCKPIEENC